MPTASEQNVVLRFGDRGDAGPRLGSGWSFPEPGWTWTVGAESRLRLPNLATPTDCVLELQLYPHVHAPRLPRQRLAVVVNDATVGQFSVTEDTTVQCRIPHALVANSATLEIVFGHPDAIAPSAVCDVADQRPLALAFRRCELFAAPIEVPLYHSDDLVPPPELMFDGATTAAQFKLVGEGFTRVNLIERGKLQPHERVLDLGSGNGQKARVLAYYLNAKGSYDGIDVVKAGVEWCKERYAAFPNFRFHWADVRSSHYNVEGTYLDSEYRLPFDDQTFDMVFLSSVFTHMLSEGVANYIAEIGRVLKHRGRCVTTFFLLNDDTRARVEAGGSALEFAHSVGPCRVVDPDDPGQAVAHDETGIRRLIAASGLRTVELTFGYWSGGRELQSALQDLLIAVKE